MRRTKMHDDLPHETQAHQLDPERHEEYRQEQGRAVRYALALYSLDEEHQAQRGAYADEKRPDQAEKS